MYHIECHKRIKRLVALFGYLNLWQRETDTTYRITFWKSFYMSFYLSYTLSIAAGFSNAVNRVDQTFTTTVLFIAFVSIVRLIYILRSKTEILVLLDNVCVYSFEDYQVFKMVDSKLTNFVNIVTCYATFLFVGLFLLIMSSVLSHVKRLPFNSAFPLDWENQTISYCIALGFLSYGMIVTAIGNLFNALHWYFMVNYCIKYELLSDELRNLNGAENENRRRLRKMDNIIGLIAAIRNHRHITGYLRCRFFIKAYIFNIITDRLKSMDGWEIAAHFFLFQTTTPQL